MIRNLKALGLALVAMFAMSAMAASAASAQPGVLTSDGQVTLIGTETGGAGANALTSIFGKVECPGSTYTGHETLTHEETSLGLKHADIVPPVSEVTITPHYKQENCTVNGGERDATVEMNGCDYVFTAGETTGGEHTYGVTAHITCPVGKQIHIGVWSAGTTHTEGRLCTIEIPGGQALTGAHLKHTTAPADDIDIEGTFTGIKSTRHGLCLLDGKGTTTNTAEFDIDATIKGLNAEGETTGVTITH